MDKILELRRKIAALLEEMRGLNTKAETEKRDFTAEESSQYATKKSEIESLRAQEQRAIELKELDDAAAATRASNGGNGATIEVISNPNDNGSRLFANLGEQLRAIQKQATTGQVDERLNKLNNESRAAAGMNESVPSEGGFAVQTDFAGMMMESAAKAGNILPRVDQFTVGAGSNSARWVEIDETDVSTTVFGGVQVFWAGEAAAVTASKPVLKEKELKLEKLMGLAYATYELENDSTFISDLYTRAFTLAIQRKLEEGIISGSGAGRPLGILNGGGLVSVAKETNQAADTIVWENLSKMYNRAVNKDSIGSYVWLTNPDVSEQLDFLSFPVGTGGVPVYLPASQEGSITTLKGRPVVESDQLKALGDKGDVLFADLSQYMLIRKGGVQADTSMHVQFLTAENAFRFIFRANGMPKKNKTLTIKNSSNARSSYVTLDARA